MRPECACVCGGANHRSMEPSGELMAGRTKPYRTRRIKTTHYRLSAVIWFPHQPDTMKAVVEWLHDLGWIGTSLYTLTRPGGRWYAHMATPKQMEWIELQEYGVQVVHTYNRPWLIWEALK